MPASTPRVKPIRGRPVTRRATPPVIAHMCRRDMSLEQVQETRRLLAQVAAELINGKVTTHA